MIINFARELTLIKVIAWKGKKHNHIQWFRVLTIYHNITFCGDFVSSGQREANRTEQNKSLPTVMSKITVYALSPDCIKRNVLRAIVGQLGRLQTGTEINSTLSGEVQLYALAKIMIISRNWMIMKHSFLFFYFVGTFTQLQMNFGIHLIM